MNATTAATSASVSRNAGIPLSTRPSRTTARTFSPAASSRRSADLVRSGPVSPPIASRPWQKPHCAANTRCPDCSWAGAWGVNLHDNDLVPIDASPSDRDRIVAAFRRACERHGVVVPMATVNLFFDPVFRDGAFTANDSRVRAYAVQKTMRAMDLAVELGARIFVLWGGREGTETDACRRPDDAIKRLREAVNYLCEYSIDREYGFKFALEAKPNEPRGDIYMATTGAYLGFIPTLDHPEM